MSMPDSEHFWCFESGIIGVYRLVLGEPKVRTALAQSADTLR